MILKIAWRNIWRRRGRSLVVISSVAVGLWAGVFVSAFYEGVINERIETVIESEVSHLQIHQKEFKEEMLAKLDIPRGVAIRDSLRSSPFIRAVSERLIAQGLIASANASSGVVINGIIPENESETTGLDEKLESGNYFETSIRNPIIISTRLAEKLKLSERSKLVITFQNSNGDITASAFRVVGLYKSINSGYDDINIFVRYQDLLPLMGNDLTFHEIAVLLNDVNQVQPVILSLKERHPELLVESWMELSSGMGYIMEFMNTYLLIVVGIILLALIFGIINAMLMAILERTREIGMMKAIGMNNRQLFSMILIETVLLSLAGAPLGLGIGYLSIYYTGKVGVNLAFASEVYSQLGFSSMVYPTLHWEAYLNVAIMVVSMAIIAAVYPAMKALSLKPIDAIRKI